MLSHALHSLISSIRGRASSQRSQLPVKRAEPYVTSCTLNGDSIGGDDHACVHDGAALAPLRLKMVSLLADCASPAQRGLLYDLRRARSARSLWMLRGEVFQQLCVQQGELIARERMASLTPLFKGHVPSAWLSRS